MIEHQTKNLSPLHLSPLLSSALQISDEDQSSLFKTTLENTCHDLFHTIRQIKNVKVGSKRELKLMQENMASLVGTGSLRPLVERKISIDCEQQCTDKSESTRVTRKTRRIGKRSPKNLRNFKIRSESLMTEEITSSFITCQFDTESTNEKQNDMTVKFKGMRLQENHASGEIGYSTLMFSQPIIEGTYYLEFKVLPPVQDLECVNQPDIRVGVCGGDHKLDVPLGHGPSIGFSLNKKAFITQGVRKLVEKNGQFGMDQDIKQGDIIGLMLEFSPPHKNPNYAQNWSESSLTIFVNGYRMVQYGDVKQMFYHPAFSLYNGAQVEVRVRQEEMSFMPGYCLAERLIIF